MEEFVSLTEGQRTALKWRFLLERCKIYLKVPQAWIGVAMETSQVFNARRCVADLPLCQDEERDEGYGPGLFAGRPWRGEAEPVCPAAAAVMQLQLMTKLR